MDFQKRYKVSLYILIPFVVSGFVLLAFVLSFRMGVSFRDLDSPWVLATVFVMLVLAGILGFLIAWIVLNPIEKFLKGAVRPSSGNVPSLPSGTILMDKDEIDRFEETVIDMTNVLSLAESKKLFPEIVGESRVLRAVLKQCALVAPTDTTVLITGESGTGKELLASAIHRLSRRKEGPYITVNCAAIPEGLLESELFGHEKGAFTGAISRKKGKFEAAHGGSIFLDEIGDMPLATQAKILRVLQERTFDRVGGNQSIQVDVRIITATNQDLAEKVKNGTFREDLYHRVRVFDITVPPLRNRREDIPLLIRHSLTEGSGPPIKVTSDAEGALMSHDWPGNVRELKNVLERTVVLSAGGPITLEHLPGERGTLRKRQEKIEAGAKTSLDENLAEIEKGLIIDALKKTGGVQARAAELLGINQRSLWHRVKKYGIDITELKQP